MDAWLNKVHQGDCVELMNQMPAESVNAIVTSAPYNIRNSTGSIKKPRHNTKWKAGKVLYEGFENWSEDLPHEEYVAWQRQCLTAMLRVLRDDGAIFYQHKWRVQAGLLQDRHDIVEGFPVRQIIIWQRSGGFNFSPTFFLPTYDVIYLICKPQFRLAPRANGQGDVWSILQDFDNPHPAPFPVELPRRCIRACGSHGIVLDPFMGSGTTAIAAEASGWDWIGFDISYCEMARERIQASRGLFFRKA